MPDFAFSPNTAPAGTKAPANLASEGAKQAEAMKQYRASQSQETPDPQVSSGINQSNPGNTE